jgi:hypothetical protein
MPGSTMRNFVQEGRFKGCFCALVLLLGHQDRSVELRRKSSVDSFWKTFAFKTSEGAQSYV